MDDVTCLLVTEGVSVGADEVAEMTESSVVDEEFVVVVVCVVESVAPVVDVVDVVEELRMMILPLCCCCEPCCE